MTKSERVQRARGHQSFFGGLMTPAAAAWWSQPPREQLFPGLLLLFIGERARTAFLSSFTRLWTSWLRGGGPTLPKAISVPHPSVANSTPRQKEMSPSPSLSLSLRSLFCNRSTASLSFLYLRPGTVGFIAQLHVLHAAIAAREFEWRLAIRCWLPRVDLGLLAQ